MVLVTPAPEVDGDGKQTKITSLETSKKSGSGAERRLVEYLVVVSSVPKTVEGQFGSNSKGKQPESNANATAPTDWKVTLSFDEPDGSEYVGSYNIPPVITARYPVHDHRDNPLHENVTFFCHPGGGIRLQLEAYMPKVHYFVATGGHGAQMYGTCLTIWEPTMIAVKKAMKDTDGNVTGTTNEEIRRKVYLPKCLVLLSTYPYLMAFREYLTQLNRLSKMGEMTLPIERYITNFCAEIPAPPPGSFEVQTTILDSVIKFWSPPHNQPICWVSLPFAHLFECLDLDNIILVWHCLVLERQVLLTSTQLSVLTITAEIFLSLLFPMRWSHAYIPVLPHFLIPILSAPMPFLCGINKANLADALYDLSSECVLVDLDKNLVTLGPDTEPLPPIPPAQLACLKQELEDNVGMVFREARCLTKNDDYSDSGAHLPNHIKLMAEGMWESKLCLFDEAFHLMFTPEEARKNMLNGNDTSGMDFSDRDINDPLRHKVVEAAGGDKGALARRQSQWDAVQEAFLDTFVYLLRNFRKYLVFPSKHNEGSYGGAGFRSKEFLESQRFDMRQFLEQLIGTQMFDNFITKRLYGSGEADVAFFDMAVDRFLKNAGYLSDVDIAGRVINIGGKVASTVSNKTGVGTQMFEEKSINRTASAGAPPRAPASKRKGGTGGKRVEPLLQSARVHRKLKTIVPPEPSGEGLPAHAHPGEDAGGVTIGDSVPSVVTSFADTTLDETRSVDSTSSVSTRETGASNPNAGSNNYKSVQDKAAEILEKQKKMRYTYTEFPSKFNEELFGTPRPLPSAVISEFDRQRKESAQFRRKKPLRQAKDANRHIQRAHTMTESEAPPSAEVATFTVFFMAFTSMVGKELMEMDHDPSAPEKAILSTYVPMTKAQNDDELSSCTGDEKDEAADAEEKEGIADLKTTRPNMNGMFGDDDEAAAVTSGAETESDFGKETAGLTAKTDAVDKKAEDEKKSDEDDVNNKGIFRENSGGLNAEAGELEKSTSEDSTDSKPKMRFKEKLSASQIEEAKATGRAQLGLAFEMLTMMKKRALKADPEAYQCLIDACGRVGDTKRATELLAKMHEDGIVADGTVYACLVSAFSAETAWRKGEKEKEDLPAWANSTSIEMDWNKLQKRSLLDRLKGTLLDDEDEEEEEGEEQGNVGNLTKIRQLIARRRKRNNKDNARPKPEESRMEFFVTEAVERQIALGENLLEIVFPDISVDTENETCPRCNYLLSDDDVVAGWTAGDENDYTTSCPSCTQRFVPHFCVQSTSPTFMGSRGPASPLMCERLSPWVLQKEIRSVMSELEGIDNLLNPAWREQAYKNAVLWWNLVLSCMRYRFPFSFLLQGSFEQNLIAPMPEDDA